MRLVEVEKAPCQHLHASNYDPAQVVQGQPIQVLGNGQMWCFDCKEFFVQQLPPRRYTLKQIETLMREFLRESPLTDKLTPQLILSSLFAWLQQWERESGDERG